jgi:hypothetical protein
MILHLGFGCISNLDSGTVPSIDQYMITIGSFLDCSFFLLQEDAYKVLRQARPMNKLQAFILHIIVICNLDCEVDVFMHAPSFSFKKVKHVLENGILNHLS